MARMHGMFNIYRSGVRRNVNVMVMHFNDKAALEQLCHHGSQNYNIMPLHFAPTVFT